MQRRLHQALGPEARFALAMSMSELAREFAKAGLRTQHPEYGEAELMRELTNQLYGRSLSRR